MRWLLVVLLLAAGPATADDLSAFAFDQRQGAPYSLADTKLLRVGSGLAALAIGLMLIFAHRRDRAA